MGPHAHGPVHAGAPLAEGARGQGGASAGHGSTSSLKVAVRVTAILLRGFQNLGESQGNDSWSKFRPLLGLTTFANFFAEIDPPWLVCSENAVTAYCS